MSAARRIGGREVGVEVRVSFLPSLIVCLCACLYSSSSHCRTTKAVSRRRHWSSLKHPGQTWLLGNEVFLLPVESDPQRCSTGRKRKNSLVTAAECWDAEKQAKRLQRGRVVAREHQWSSQSRRKHLFWTLLSSRKYTWSIHDSSKTEIELRKFKSEAITAEAVRMKKQHYSDSFNPSDQLKRQGGKIMDVTSAHTPITVNNTQQHCQSLLSSVPLVVCPDQTGPIHRQDPIANFQSAIRGSGSIGDQRADVNSWSVEGSVLRQRGGGG